ncbi:M48 family metallopeptidase [Kiloniella majae]|uniref:M48 family metallopeptidase n=1 Tax=Kiloniella majae TaxID=1938558 RepID=UPI000F78C8DF|nr:M48 family metallopeptidase [Kiloniella majae]
MSSDTLALISTDFKSAQARNKRNSFILCLIMIFTATFLGYISGWAAEIFTGTHPALIVAPYDASVIELLKLTAISDWGISAAAGMIVFSILALIWTYFAADQTLLSMNGAIEADTRAYEDLHNVVEEMAIASGLPKPAVYIIQDAGINAFATGLRPDKASVTVTTGLYDVMSRDELQGVIAHEMAHILNRDVQYAVLVAVGAGLIAVFAEIMLRISRLFFYSGASSSSRKGKKGNQGALILIVGVVWLLAAILAPLVAYLVRMAISREREYLADATAAQLTRNPKGLASALSKIEGHAHLKEKNAATEHLFIINPNRSFSELASDLTSTHPATSLRIERLMNLK